jgi:hypothetical protein
VSALHALRTSSCFCSCTCCRKRFRLFSFAVFLEYSRLSDRCTMRSMKPRVDISHGAYGQDSCCYVPTRSTAVTTRCFLFYLTIHAEIISNTVHQVGTGWLLEALPRSSCTSHCIYCAVVKWHGRFEYVSYWCLGFGHVSLVLTHSCTMLKKLLSWCCPLDVRKLVFALHALQAASCVSSYASSSRGPLIAAWCER